jgi:hypothetical protein
MAGQLNPCTCQPIIVKGHVHQKANHSDLASKVSFLSKLQPLVNKKANGKNKAIGVISGQPGEKCAKYMYNCEYLTAFTIYYLTAFTIYYIMLHCKVNIGPSIYS